MIVSLKSVPFVFLLSILFLTSFSHATVCEKTTYYNNSRYNTSGTVCTLRKAVNAQIKITATLSDNYVHSGIHADISSSSGNSFRIFPGDTISHTYVTYGDTETISYNIYDERGGSHSPLTVSVREIRSNATPIKAVVQDNGDITYGYEFNNHYGAYPLKSTRDSYVELWYATSSGGLSYLVDRKSMWHCNKRTLPCSQTFTIPAWARPPMNQSQDKLFVKVDTSNIIPETTENDNQVYTEFPEEVFLEEIPIIMRGLPATPFKGPWSEAARLLDLWFSHSRDFANPRHNNAIDWTVSLDDKNLSMAWALDPNSARDNRVITAFEDLINPDYFLKRNVIREVFKPSLKARLSGKPRGTTISLSNRHLTGQAYHNQHIQNILVQSGGFNSSPLDGITGALGGWSMYLVPYGTATKLKSGIKVVITKVRVHTTDMFDFRGWQPLGCWKYGYVGTTDIVPGTNCAWNSEFVNYQRIKYKGGDFILMSKRRVVKFPSPIEKTLAVSW